MISKIEKITFLGIAMAVLFAAMAFPAGQTEEGTTVIDIPRQPRVYIAPENPDAEHRELVLDPEIAPAPDRIILSYELIVFDADGDEIWSDSEEITESRGFFGNLFNIGDRPQIDPEVIRDLRWDGTDNDGEPVPDDDYIYQLFVTDDEGETYRTPPQNVTVDNEAPSIDRLEPEFSVFSPGVEGSREELPIRQDGTAEVSWIGRFTNEDDEVVREYRWENSVQYDPDEPTRQQTEEDQVPPDFSWDGRDEDGDVVEDGTYTYELIGRDRPGNRTTETVEDIRVATEEGDVSVTPSRDAFSPQGPTPEVDLELSYDEILEVDEWTVEVVDAETESTEFRSFSGEGAPPDSVAWDGTDEAGDVVADDTYHVVFSILYENGVETSSRAAPVVVDTEEPEAELMTSPDVFGGETRPFLSVDGDWDTDASWTAIIEVDGEEFEFELDELAEEYNVTPDIMPVEWTGVDLDGEMLPDGSYSGYLRGVDDAENVGESNEVSFILDTRDTPVDVELDETTVSPDFRGVDDEITIRPILEVTDRVDTLRVSILDMDGETVRTFEQDDAVDSLEWDGRDELGEPVSEGEYEAELQVFYENGNQPTAVSETMFVDRDAPEVNLSVPYTEFAPNDDGYRDLLPVEVDPVETEGIASWVASVEDSDGDVVRTIAGDGVPPDTIEWDGRDETGDIVDGNYRVGMRIQYDGGGEVDVAVEDDILVDASGPDTEIEGDPIPFTPEYNGTEQDLILSLSAEDEWSDIAEWSVELMDPEGNVFRTFDGEGEPPAEIEWDGMVDEDEMVMSAVDYSARFTVRDELRNESVEELDILTDIIVREENGRLQIVVPSIEFEPYESYLFAEIDDTLEENLETLRSLARVLNEFEDRDIIVEGHANHIRYEDEEQMQAEQEEYLLPLSEDRAIAVRDALAILGVDLDRMTVEAVGGDRPVADFDDFDNIWKNRRVEFLLDRNDE